MTNAKMHTRVTKNQYVTVVKMVIATDQKNGVRMSMKKILNFLLKPLFDFGILPKLAPTGYLHEMNVVIGEVRMNKCCGTCKYHKHEDISDGYICVNLNSDNCADWTENESCCDEWEGVNEYDNE